MFESLAENKEVWSAFKDAYRVRRDLSKYLGTFYLSLVVFIYVEDGGALVVY